MLTFRRGNSELGLRRPVHEHLDHVNERTRVYLRSIWGTKPLRKSGCRARRFIDLHERAMFYAQAVVHVEEELRGIPTTRLQDYAQFKWKPVGIREFICSPALPEQGDRKSIPVCWRPQRN